MVGYFTDSIEYVFRELEDNGPVYPFSPEEAVRKIWHRFKNVM